MEYTRTRVMKVPVKDDGTLHGLLKLHKKATNDALIKARDDVRKLPTFDDIEERKQEINRVRREIEAEIKKSDLPKAAVNLTIRTSVETPIRNYVKWCRNRMQNKTPRAPRFRRLMLKLRPTEIRIDLDAHSPSVELAVAQSPTGRGSLFKSFGIGASQRYLNRYKHMEQTAGFLFYKHGRVWLGAVFVEKISCNSPQTFIGVDVGMYRNKKACAYVILDSQGNLANNPDTISADVDPTDVAQAIIDKAKENNSAIILEGLTSLGFGKAGIRIGFASAKFAKEIQRLAEDNAVWVENINPRGTSSTCHSCGGVVKRDKVHDWTDAECLSCGMKYDADFNASINIAMRGMKQIEQAT